MGAKVKHSTIVITLLVLSLSGAVAQDRDTAGRRQKLIALFKTALVNDSYNLWMLQQVFFNPDSNQSPGLVCLAIFVMVDTIADPYGCLDSGAFINDGFGWQFDSYYELHQHVADASDVTSELATLISKSGSTSMFYTMDPTFYSIMNLLSSSIALSIPYIPYYHSSDHHAGGFSDYGEDYAYIHITFTELDENPCWDDAVYALRSVLMWVSNLVSLNCP